MNHGSALDLNTGNMVVAGAGNNSLNMNYKTKWGNWAPRVGLSYQLNPKTVIHAGYGCSFAMGTFGTTFVVEFTESLPIFATQSIVAPAATASAFNLAVGPPDFVFPTVPSNGMIPLPNGIMVTTRPNPSKFSTVDAWNASFQRAFTPTWTMTVAYAGNKGTHVWSGIFSTINVNQAFAVLPASLSSTGQTASYTPGMNINLLKPYYGQYGWT